MGVENFANRKNLLCYKTLKKSFIFWGWKSDKYGKKVRKSINEPKINDKLLLISSQLWRQ